MPDPKPERERSLLPSRPAADAPKPESEALGRRGAIIRMAEIGLGIAGATILTSGASEKQAEARRPPPPVEPQRPLVSLELVDERGDHFPTFAHGGELWIAGVEGERYNLRIQNNTPERVEVVVSVDGRDVITGRLGDYVKQRGYVLDPFGVLVIEGYRQSLDKVAAFRFADLADSYTARLGTPIHAGVIGLAAFSERKWIRRRKRPLAPVEGEPFPGEDAAPTARPSVVTGTERARDKAARRSRSGGGAEESWAAPEELNQLGTEFGESTFSPVEEVPFKRRRRRKPEQLLVLRYDSMAGLRERGVAVEPRPRPRPRPEPIRPRRHTGRDFAPPPPPKDWWR